MVAGSWIDHEKLQIVKGVGKTATDAFSAENDPVVVNLLGGIITLETTGWSPQIAATKSGGVWADSPITDGRTLLAAPEGNVTEKMTLVIADRSYLAVVKALSGLTQMARDCRDFWQTATQTDQVYLVWKAKCGAGEQYALLYNIEVATEYKDGPDPIINATITLEREPFWRGLPPGANPKLWTFYVNNQQIGLGSKVLADATLVTGSDHLITQTIQNKFEWTPAAAGLQTTPISQNYIDISASQVPGDAPALLEISISPDIVTPANIYIGKTSKKLSGTGHDGIARANALILNVGDGYSGSNLTKTAGISTTGVKSNGSSATFYYGTRTSTGVSGNWVNAAGWGGLVPANGIKLDRELFRGTYAVFARACNNSGTPVLADMRMRVLINEYEDNASEYLQTITLNEVNPPMGSVRPLSYMGTVTFPFGNRSVQSPLGYGRQLQGANSNIQIILQYFVDVATANRIFEAVDVIFMPVDEGMAQIVTTDTVGTVAGAAILDNTGYFTRGTIEQNANGYISNADSGGVGQEVRGQPIMLSPKVNQRLYFISDDNTSPVASALNKSFTCRLNIVPRWAGIRDT